MIGSFIIKIIVLCLVSIKAYALDKVLLFGDSLMAGFGLPNEQHLYVVLEEDLKKSGQNIKVVNGSVSGSTSSAGLNRAEWTLSEPDIDLMILGLGANDMLRGIRPSETEKNLEKIILAAKENNIKVVLAGMYAPTTHGGQFKKEFDKIYPYLANKHNLTLIPFLLEGVALNPKLNQSDGIHPNYEGTLIVSKTLKDIILKLKAN